VTEKSNPTERFTGLADAYASYRPDYPETALLHVIERCHLGPASLMVDVGCGTGISARAFARLGIAVLGIEPNDEMREKAESAASTGDSKNPPKFRKGTAEQTGLADTSADAVLCAQAFHWFDPERSLAEFHRILKPGGHCILIWNERNEADLFTREYGTLIRDNSEAVSVEVKRGVSGKALLLSDLFETVGVTEFSNSQSMDEEGLLGRAFSTSYAPRQGSRAERLRIGLKELYRRYGAGGAVTLKYTTTVYIARKDRQ